MVAIPNTLHIEIDESYASHNDLVGLKLDKSKCFDRLMPSVTAALVLAYGLPKGFTSFFTRIYQGLKRHLAYKGWAHNTVPQLLMVWQRAAA